MSLSNTSRNTLKTLQALNLWSSHPVALRTNTTDLLKFSVDFTEIKRTLYDVCSDAPRMHKSTGKELRVQEILTRHRFEILNVLNF